MENKGQMNSQEAKMQGLVDLFLKTRSAGEDPAAPSFHLDDDSLAAFAEGSLSERETRPVVSHLVDCGFCRHITVELVRLDLEFAENDAFSPAAENREPSKVSEVLSGLLSKIFGTSDNAVFAHNENDKEGDKAAETDKDKEI